jgi:hypothetical protein
MRNCFGWAAVGLATVVSFSTASRCSAQQLQPTGLPEFTWERSLPIDSQSSGINAIGGTELRAIVPFAGSLFAANGYWLDKNKDNPNAHGAQIFRLDGPTSSWVVDAEFDLRGASGNKVSYANSIMDSVTFTTDSAGNPLRRKVSFLLASPWSHEKGIVVFSRTAGSSTWGIHQMPAEAEAAPGSQIRAFALYKDSVTHTDRVFAGLSGAKIYSGTYSGDHSGWR